MHQRCCQLLLQLRVSQIDSKDPWSNSLVGGSNQTSKLVGGATAYYDPACRAWFVSGKDIEIRPESLWLRPLVAANVQFTRNAVFTSSPPPRRELRIGSFKGPKPAEALLAFKSAVGNPQQLSNWVGRDLCSTPWTGVTCSYRFEDSTIVSLKLTGLKLEGYIPPNLQNLSSLVTLWLDDNHLKGPIPLELGYLNKLTSLRLAGNFLSENLPATIAVLPNLKELTLANNCLRGSLPLEGALLKIPYISLHGNVGLCSRSRKFNLSDCGSNFSLGLTLSPRAAEVCKPNKTRTAAIVGGVLNAPTLTPSKATNVGKSRKQRVGAIVSGVVGAVVLVGIVVAAVCFYLMCIKRSMSRISESGSSEPSPRGSPRVITLSPYEVHNLRPLTTTELEIATNNFSENNIIGEGGFGLVYKGLLEDGSIVAIKRRYCDPSQDFLRQVVNIGHIRHKHIVSLIGYFQGMHQQLLVYDYLPNGSVGNHLYDTEGRPTGKLDILQRLSIALGAAKGLEHLHSLSPPLLHMHFKTRNVLVDENFTSRVADFGLSTLLIGGNRAGSSLGYDCFLDPELSISNGFSEASDVYGFGVFLLELITGHEALNQFNPEPEQSLVAQVWPTHSVATAMDHVAPMFENPKTILYVMLSQAKRSFDTSFIDKTMGEDVEDAMHQLAELALQCVDTGPKRPTMKRVVEELEQILEREMGRRRISGMVEEIGTVTLGSELFK